MDLTDFLLHEITAYGPLILGLATLLAAAGLPTPATPLVLAAGALARQGLINWQAALLLALFGVVLGDATSYGIGRFAGNWVDRYATGRRAGLIHRAEDQYRRFGGLAVYLTHTIFVSLDVPSNLVAGSSHYPFPRFLFFVLTGRGTWILFYGALGYALGSQWQQARDLASRYTLWLGLLLALLIAMAYLWRRSGRGLRPRLFNRSAPKPGP